MFRFATVQPPSAKRRAVALRVRPFLNVLILPQPPPLETREDGVEVAGAIVVVIGAPHRPPATSDARDC